MVALMLTRWLGHLASVALRALESVLEWRLMGRTNESALLGEATWGLGGRCCRRMGWCDWRTATTLWVA